MLLEFHTKIVLLLRREKAICLLERWTELLSRRCKSKFARFISDSVIACMKPSLLDLRPEGDVEVSPRLGTCFIWSLHLLDYAGSHHLQQHNLVLLKRKLLSHHHLSRRLHPAEVKGALPTEIIGAGPSPARLGIRGSSGSSSSSDISSCIDRLRPLCLFIV